LGGLHNDPPRELKKRHARLRQGIVYPKPDASVEFQPPALYQFRDFPTGDDTDTEGAVDARIEKLAMRWI
jgi:hypothetical protein